MKSIPNPTQKPLLRSSGQLLSRFRYTLDFLRNSLGLKKFFIFAANQPKREILATRWSYARCLLPLSLLLLCACVRVPDHETAKNYETASCESVSFKRGNWPQSNWWELFQDQTLNELINLGLKLNPTLKKTEELLKAASQVAWQKRSRLFPEINFDADDNWQHLAKEGFFRAFAPIIPPVINDVHLGFSYHYEFDFWGKNRKLFRAALGIADAMAAEKQQAELILTTSIAYTYIQTQLLLHLKNLTAKIEQNKREILKTREKRQFHALDAATLRLQSHANQLEESASLLEYDQQIEILIHKLKTLSGTGQDAELVISERPISRLLVTLPENISLDLLARRPDLVAQKMRMEAAAEEIGAAKTDFYPNINLMGVLGFETIFSLASLFTKQNYNGNIDPAIHLPIFTAGRIKAHLFEKVAEFNQAVYEYNALILQAAQEVVDSVSKISLLEKEAEVWTSATEIAESQAHISEKRFRHALDDQIALLTAKNNALAQRKKLNEIEFGKLLVSIQLIRSLGGGYHHE